MYAYKQALPTCYRRPVYYGFEWQTLAESIRQRDKETCQTCGQPGRQVHHCNPYRLVGLHDPSNLVTLCQSCHGTADALLQYQQNL